MPPFVDYVTLFTKHRYSGSSPLSVARGVVPEPLICQWFYMLELVVQLNVLPWPQSSTFAISRRVDSTAVQP